LNDLKNNKKRILGIDFGSVRVGVAVSDPLRIIAQSLGTFKNDRDIVSKIAEISKEYDVGMIIAGMPYTLKGEKGAKANEVDAFILRLKEKLHLDVVTWDERFTSKMARQTLIEMGTTKKQRRASTGRVDSTAAALILQSFLDQTKHSFQC
jgi:putative pre-16S rRNA nuclease